MIVNNLKFLNGEIRMIKRIVLYSLLFTSLLSVSAYAGTDDETAYALNTLLFLISGFLVMLMAACLLYTSDAADE